MRRAIACVVLLVVVIVPVLGVAGDDLSSSRHGSHREAGLRQQAPRPWRTVQAAVEWRPSVPPAGPLAALDTSEPAPALLLLVRTPFVPPRA